MTYEEKLNEVITDLAYAGQDHEDGSNEYYKAIAVEVLKMIEENVRKAMLEKENDPDSATPYKFCLANGICNDN